MGRNTWESLPKKDALPRLPDRINIIVSNSMVLNGVISILGNLTVAMPLEETLDYIKACGMDIGGGQIYNALLPYCDRVYVTKIYDTFFPNLDESKEWNAIEEDSYNDIKYQFWRYDRVS